MEIVMKRRVKKITIAIASLLILSLTLAVACGASRPSGTGSDQGPQAPINPPSGGKADSGDFPDGALPAGSTERKVIRNANMILTVKDVLESRDEVSAIAVRLAGYTVSSSFSGRDEELRGTITIRVPDDKFDQALSELRKLGVRVRSEGINSLDVTEEYVDLTARLKNAEATENQYRVILERAVTVEEILKVQEKLSQVRSQIEQIKGRIQYLEQQTSMSLITVSLEPDGSDAPLTVFNWNPIREARNALRGFLTFLTLLGTILIWVLVFSPVWGGVIALIYLIRRLRRRKLKTA
jgi:hypothetical protein